jgi:HSP20 family molecular chaperone IbpA
VQATLPGVQPDQLEINFADQVLTVKGECKVPEIAKEARYHLRERPVGKFERSFRVQLHKVKIVASGRQLKRNGKPPNPREIYICMGPTCSKPL